MKIQLFRSPLPKLYLLQMLLILVPALHMPHIILLDIRFDLMLWHFYIMQTGHIPAWVILILFGLARDILHYDLLFLSSLGYIIFCRISFIYNASIAKKSFMQIWLVYIANFTAVYLGTLLIHSFLAQYLFLNGLSIAELLMGYAAYPLMHCCFMWLRVGKEAHIKSMPTRGVR